MSSITVHDISLKLSNYIFIIIKLITCLYIFRDRDKNTMIYDYQICFSIQFRRVTNIDFPSAQTPMNLAKCANTLHDSEDSQITSKHGYVDFLAYARPILEGLPLRIPPNRCDSTASSFETHRRRHVVESRSHWRAIERRADIALQPIPVSESIKFISCSVHDDGDYARA